MAPPKVIIVHLRRPYSASERPDERRDDPFYEFGSFGCTGCHSNKLLSPNNAKELEGARLAFLQGGQDGSRLVYLTPPITVKVWHGQCEARWTLAEMPFKYTRAPILAHNNKPGDFPLMVQLARGANRTTIEAALSSLFRSRKSPLDAKTAHEVIQVYESIRSVASASEIASTYDEALPTPPPHTDRKRKATYDAQILKLKVELAAETDGVESVSQVEGPPPQTRTQSRCGRSRRRKSSKTADRPTRRYC
jgi:hypothetical protein